MYVSTSNQGTNNSLSISTYYILRPKCIMNHHSKNFKGVQETNIFVYKQTLVQLEYSWLSKISWVTMHKMFDRRHLRCMKGENNNIFTIIEGCFLLMPRLQYINTFFSPFLTVVCNMGVTFKANELFVFYISTSRQLPDVIFNKQYGCNLFLLHR